MREQTVRCRPPFPSAAAALVLLTAITAPAAGEPLRAVPVTVLTIDGRLGDWPAEMVAGPIDLLSERPYGMWRGGPDEPGDFTGRFHAGYDEAAGRLYVAVVVEDDEAALPGYQQDACFLSLHPDLRHAGASRSAGMQYVLSADPGARPQTLPMADATPGVDGRSRRLGTTTVYEWALPLTAARGDSVGLRLVVSDGDGTEAGGHMSWGSAVHAPGVLILGGEEQDQGVRVDPWGPDETSAMLTGTVRSPTGEPLDGVLLAIRHDGRVAATPRSDAEGVFEVELLPRDYTVEVVPGFGIEVGEATALAVAGDSHITLQAEPLRVPAELQRAALVYRRLLSYRDTTQLGDETRRGRVQSGGTRDRVLVFERPNRIRLTVPDALGETVVVSDGEFLAAMANRNGRMEHLRHELPENLSSAVIRTALSAGTIVDGLVLRLLLAEEPMEVLTHGTAQIRQTGEEWFGHTPTWVFELERFRWAGVGPRRADAVGDSVLMYVWVGQADHLIRRVVIEEEVPEDTNARREAGTHRREWRHRAIRVDEPSPAETFSLDVPEGSRLVERFGTP